VSCFLYLFLQFVGLVLHLTGATRRVDWLGTLGSVCSLAAWFVLLVGLARVVIKLRELAAMRAERRARRVGR
jgi:Kef-type K+ transport system membrane component KefB